MSRLIKKNIKNYTVFCRNESDYNILFDEIFVEEIYKFSSDKKNPFIIDCGSNIGLSILYFKILYPGSKILAFEPDVDNYKVIVKNIKINNIKNVTVYNLALYDKVGKTYLYYESKKGSALGNTTDIKWGDRKDFSKKLVKTDCLSNYLNNKKVDFLKIDVEGAEKLIFNDIKKYLISIKELALEYHSVNNPSNKKNYKYIINLLKENGFLLDVRKINMVDFMPTKYVKWLNKYKPFLCFIKATKK